MAELFSAEHDLNEDDTPVGVIAKFNNVSLLPSMNIKAVIAQFDRAEAEVLAVWESVTSAKIIGMLTEAYVARRYIEELGQAAHGILDPK